MIISGVQKFTLLDFPGKVACVVFTAGCNFRCGYCHNPEFVLPERIAEISKSFINQDIFFRFLQERIGLLDGVVITGGEPTLMVDLMKFMATIKSMGFLVKLDTNGNRPEVINEAIRLDLVDYIAMDVKTSLDEYGGLVGRLVRPEKIKESIDLLKSGNTDYEFRTTLVKEIHSRDVLHDMARLINGANRLYLQSFRSAQTLNPVFSDYHAFSMEEINEIAAIFQPHVGEVIIR